jgi:hypothetical protein
MSTLVGANKKSAIIFYPPQIAKSTDLISGCPFKRKAHHYSVETVPLKKGSPLFI